VPPEPQPIESATGANYIEDKSGNWRVVGDPDGGDQNQTWTLRIFTPEPLVDESLLVDEDGGIANVMVLYEPELIFGGDKGSRSVSMVLHPDHNQTSEHEKEATITIENGRFSPRVTAQWNHRVVVANRDSVPFRVKVTRHGNQLVDNHFSLGPLRRNWPRMSDHTEPIPVSCVDRPWMKAYVLVRNNPYFAVTAADGTFEIKNLPAGKRKFRVWHERTGWLDAGQLDEGYLEVDLIGSITQLPTFQISAETFEPAFPAEEAETNVPEENEAASVSPAKGGPLVTGNLTLYYDFEHTASPSPVVNEIVTNWLNRQPIPIATLELELDVNNFPEGKTLNSEDVPIPRRGLSQQTITLIRSGTKFFKNIDREDRMPGPSVRIEHQNTEAFNGRETR
jgi:hypothetical protein